ncbi:MAG: DUF4091 domain-containing protein, partial [Armatimonadetes bacterium]|nr:DUF4091 domain-containing protein [Armatimonadota bacterium]
KEGVGWKGTGISWPGISHLKEVRVLDRNPKRWILEATGEFVGSSPANRRYEITFHLYVPAGQPWFATRMVRFKNSDETRFRLGGFFHILSSSIEKPQVVNGNGYALWIGDGRAVGAISASTEMRFDPAPIYIQKQVWLDPGQETEGFGPTMVFFAGDASNADEAKALVERIRVSWGQQDPSAWTPTGDAKLTVEEKQDITVTHDFADFDKYASKYLDEWKFNGFTFGDVPETLAGFKKGTPEYMRMHALIYGRQAEHLREKGWLDEAYSYWKDEPTEEEYGFVNEGMDILKQSCPGLTRLMTEQVEDKLVGHVDLWTPVLSAYDPKKCQARQKAGDHVWWYVCCGPGAPYPNNFIDHPAINHRIRYWLIEKYGVEGDLYWATTFYYRENYKQRNPWEHGMSVSPDGGYWGNGDGMLLYPACRKPSETPVTDPPVVSQRIELIREGLEDLEYFWALKQEMKKLETLLGSLPAAKQTKARKLMEKGRKSLTSPDRLAKSLTEYTKDPQELLRERERMAEVIEAMVRSQT